MPTPHTPSPVSTSAPALLEHDGPPQPPLTLPALAITSTSATDTPPSTYRAGIAPPRDLSASDEKPSDAHHYTLSHSRIQPPPRLDAVFNRSPSHSSLLSQKALAAADGTAKHHAPQLSGQHTHERPSTVLATFLNRWLPSLLSTRPVRHTFTRNLDNAIRGVVAFVVSAIIAVQPWALGVLAVPYLFPVFAVTTIRPTAGSSIAGLDLLLKGVGTAVVVDMIITGAQISRLTPVNRIIACEVVLFVTSIGMAYYFRPPVARRFALAIHALIVVQIALGVDQVVLPLQTLLGLVLACCVALVLITLPFPRLARDELLDRYQQSLLSLSNVFREIVRCYLSTEPMAPQVLNTALAAQLDAVCKSLIAMRRLQTEAAMECSLYSLCFPSSITVGCPVIADPDRIEQLYWINMNLLDTLSTLHYSSYHAAFVHYLRRAFCQLSSEQSAYLTMLGSPDSCQVTKERVEQCKRRLDDAMAESWKAYSKARRKLYGYGMADQSHTTEQPAAGATTHRRNKRHSIWREQLPPHHHSHSDDDADSAMHHSTAGSQESARLLVKPERRTDGSSNFPNEPSILLHSTQEVFWRSTFFYYVSRFHHSMHLLPLDNDVLAVSPTVESSAASATFQPVSSPSNVSSPASASSATSAATARVPSTSVWPRKRFALRRLYTQLKRDPLSWSFIGFHPIKDAVYLIRTFGAFVRKPAIDWVWLRGSVIISFIVCVVSLFAVIPQLSTTQVFPNAYWAPFTAAILASDTQGAMVQRALHRLFGTLLGGLIGYLLLYAFPSNYYGSIPLLALWCFVMQFVQNSSYAYLGMLASFTPIIIVFGYQLPGSGNLTVERFALSRMEEIAIGILVAVVLSSVLWPVSSIRLLRSEMTVSVQSFKAAVGHTSEIYDRLVMDERTDTLADKASQDERKEAADHTADNDAKQGRATAEVEIEIVRVNEDGTRAVKQEAATAGHVAPGDKQPPSCVASPSTADGVDSDELTSQSSRAPHHMCSCSVCTTAI